MLKSPLSVAIVVALSLSSKAFAQHTCGAVPQFSGKAEEAHKIKGDLEGKATALSRLVGSGSLFGAYEKEMRTIYQSASDIAAAQQGAYLLYMFCVIVMGDPNLSTEQKIKAVREYGGLPSIALETLTGKYYGKVGILTEPALISKSILSIRVSSNGDITGTFQSGEGRASGPTPINGKVVNNSIRFSAEDYATGATIIFDGTVSGNTMSGSYTIYDPNTDYSRIPPEAKRLAREMEAQAGWYFSR